jgi:3-phenylpropionate/trans-cinnamate dioxygenase ferredoxin subunit
MKGWRTVARLSDLPPGGKLGVEVDGCEVALLRRGDAVFAVADACPHAQAPLSQMGVVEGGRLVCVLHGAAFDLDTGASRGPLCDEPLPVYPVRIIGDEIQIRLEREGG